MAKIKKYASGGEMSPNEIVDNIERRQNEEDLDLVPRAGRMLRDKLNEDLTGGAYVGNRLDVGKDRGSRFGRVSKEDSDLIAKTDALNKANPNRPRHKGMQSMMDALGAKSMKSGGSVKSASARADGCAIRGKTRA